jgi:hypothetical protein
MSIDTSALFRAQAQTSRTKAPYTLNKRLMFAFAIRALSRSVSRINSRTGFAQTFAHAVSRTSASANRRMR